MNYEEMSDWEVTKRVVEIQCAGQHIKYPPQEDAFSPMVTGVMSNDLKIITESNREQSIDVCNGAREAWNLMVANGISLITLGDEWEAHHLDDHGDESNNIVQSKPGRAIAICFLKMKDADNGN